MPTAINTSTQTDSRAFYAEKRATANWQCYTYKKKKKRKASYKTPFPTSMQSLKTPVTKNFALNKKIFCHSTICIKILLAILHGCTRNTRVKISPPEHFVDVVKRLREQPHQQQRQCKRRLWSCLALARAQEPFAQLHLLLLSRTQSTRELQHFYWEH